MSEEGLTRRVFMASSGGVLVGTLAFAAGAVALAAPTRTWALTLNALAKDVGETLLRFTRQLYPHDRLEDAVYALVVRALDAEAAASPDVTKLLTDGVAALDRAAGGRWRDQPQARQLELAKEMEQTPLFQKVRSTAVVALYDNDMAFAHFGYEGASFEKGGYLGRGFNDLDWLPQPPTADSTPL